MSPRSSKSVWIDLFPKEGWLGYEEAEEEEEADEYEDEYEEQEEAEDDDETDPGGDIVYDDGGDVGDVLENGLVCVPLGVLTRDAGDLICCEGTNLCCVGEVGAVGSRDRL